MIVLTGPTDYISDGTNVAVLENGDGLLGKITGSGCILGSIIASFCATAMHEVEVQDNERTRIVDLERLFAAAIAGCVLLLFRVLVECKDAEDVSL